jgi:hypothetical protein
LAFLAWCFFAFGAEASAEPIADGAEAMAGAEAEAEAEGAAAKAEAANREATRAAMILDILNSSKGVKKTAILVNLKPITRLKHSS